jgi:hypothetical protein
MKKIKDLSFEEKKEITALFANWLNSYSHDAIVRAMEHREEIINNEFAMNLLKELKQREEEEQKDFTDSIERLITAFDSFKEYNPHNHPLTHAGSYRDILYDMFIRR